MLTQPASFRRGGPPASRCVGCKKCGCVWPRRPPRRRLPEIDSTLAAMSFLSMLTGGEPASPPGWEPEWDAIGEWSRAAGACGAWPHTAGRDARELRVAAARPRGAPPPWQPGAHAHAPAHPHALPLQSPPPSPSGCVCAWQPARELGEGWRRGGGGRRRELTPRAPPPRHPARAAPAGARRTPQSWCPWAAWSVTRRCPPCWPPPPRRWTGEEAAPAPLSSSLPPLTPPVHPPLPALQPALAWTRQPVVRLSARGGRRARPEGGAHRAGGP